MSCRIFLSMYECFLNWYNMEPSTKWQGFELE